jgi:high-affinity nickel-transport protein
VTATLWIALALGLRHGADPDHLTAIDGLTRIRPRATTGVLFALGHGFVVTLLAAGVGRLLANPITPLGPWMLLLVGAVNLWKTLRLAPLAQGKATRPSPGPLPPTRPLVAQPFLLGMILAAGFETASQLSVLVLASQTNPWLLGAAFSTGMMLVDGADGYLAASTISRGVIGPGNARLASRCLGFVVAIFAFGLGGAGLAGVEIGPSALPLSLALVAVVIAMRVWAGRPAPAWT